jgi:PKD repeat protein
MKKKHYVMDGKKQSSIIYIPLMLAICIITLLLVVPVSADSISYSAGTPQAVWGVQESGFYIYYNQSLNHTVSLTYTTIGYPYPGGSSGTGHFTLDLYDGINKIGSNLGSGAVHWTSTCDNDPPHDNNYCDVTLRVDSLTWNDASIFAVDPSYLDSAKILYWVQADDLQHGTDYSTFPPQIGGVMGAVPDINRPWYFFQEGNGNYNYEYSSNAALIPICSFTAAPTSGQSPLLVTFTDTSLNNPTSFNWNITDSSTGVPVLLSSAPVWQNFVNGANKQFDINFTASNAYGSCNLFSPQYLHTTTANLIILNLDVRDALSGNLIAGSSVGIYNATSNIWRNTTAPTGLVYYDSSDVTPQIPLSIGQNVTLAAGAYGYSDASTIVIIPYNGYTATLNLMPKTAVNATGTFWLTVNVIKNEDGLPLNSAVVQVLSGGNSYQQYTNSAGTTTFQNITSGYTFSVTAFAQAYTAQTKILPKDADFINVSFSLVRIGGTPVTTPVSPAPTETPTPIYTNPATGQQISAPEGQATDVFARLAAALGGWASLAIGIVEITLLWMLVYAITGGDIINKIMRRGRGKK